jgi:hypothetical protein
MARHYSPRVAPRLALALVVQTFLATSALHAPAARAAEVTLTVTTLADNFTSPVAGSRREAINAANADPANNLRSFQEKGRNVATQNLAGAIL